MTPMELEQSARKCFEQSSKTYRDAPKWEELHEDTRAVYYDWVLRARYQQPNKASEGR